MGGDDLLYRSDIVKSVSKMLEKLNNDNILFGLIFPNTEVGCEFIQKLFDTIEGAQSSYWHPCTDEENIPDKEKEVLVTLKYPNGKTEVAFGSNWGRNVNGDIAYWGGQNGLVVAWGEKPKAYEGRT